MYLGIDYLRDGLPLVVVALGLFAFPEIVDLLRLNRPIAKGSTLGAGWLQGFRDTMRHWFLCLRCSGLGALIGAIPGLGGSVVDWIAYGHVVQTSRDKSKFGSGDIRGVLAPESANNACQGGALMPTLLFGVPGSGSMAVLLAGLVLLGVEPGPSMVDTNLSLTYTVVWSLAIANVIGAGICLVLAGPIARLTLIPFTLIAPFMMVVITFAAFQARRDLADLVLLLAGSYVLWAVSGRRVDHPANQDQEVTGAHVRDPGVASPWTSVAWFAALFALAALVGYILAVALFFLAFVRKRANRGWPMTLVFTVAVLAGVVALGHALSLDFPRGLLQETVDLPWPLN